MTTDLRELWDFEDPAGSEQGFRALAGRFDEPMATYAWTQVARALGLQERYDEGDAVLGGRGAGCWARRAEHRRTPHGGARGRPGRAARRPLPGLGLDPDR